MHLETKVGEGSPFSDPMSCAAVNEQVVATGCLLPVARRGSGIGTKDAGASEAMRVADDLAHRHRAPTGTRCTQEGNPG